MIIRFKVFFKDGVGEWKWNEAVGAAVECAESLEFSFHFPKFAGLFVVPVCTLYIGYRVVRTEAGKGVDVSVCVVACQMSVMEP